MVSLRAGQLDGLCLVRRRRTRQGCFGPPRSEGGIVESELRPNTSGVECDLQRVDELALESTEPGGSFAGVVAGPGVGGVEGPHRGQGTFGAVEIAGVEESLGQVAGCKSGVEVDPPTEGMIEGGACVVGGVDGTAGSLSRERTEGQGCGQRP